MKIRSYLTFHMQDPFPEWNVILNQAYLAGKPFRSIKVFHPEDYATVKAASPSTKVVYRPWVDKLNQGHFIYMAATGRAHEAADEFIDSWIDSVRAYMPEGYIESINEEYPTGNIEKLKAIVAFDIAFIERLADRLPNHRAIVFTAAVGNPGWEELSHLMPLAERAQTWGAAFGYHGYHPVKDKVSGVDLESAKDHLHLRFEGIDFYLRNQGYTVDWFIGEAGAMGVEVLDPPPGGNWGMSVVNGWKHSSVWGGDLDAYMADLARLDWLLARTSVAEDGRLLGCAIFTSRPGDDPAWKLFNVIGFAAHALGDLVAGGVEVDDPVPAPPPPPPPPPPEPEPEPEVDYVVTVNLLPQDATLAEKQIVLEATHEKRQTILQSAQDAARLVAPGLPGSAVIVWNAERWTGGDIGAWLRERGVEDVIFSRFETVWS